MSRGGEMVLGIVFCPEGYNCIGYPKTGKKKKCYSYLFLFRQQITWNEIKQKGGAAPYCV